jgi:GR25 family glycosyltransferase involved in LPS biosynthesis
MSMGETIDYAAYKYTFVTYATARFIPSLRIWLDINVRHAAAIGGTVIVYLGTDINNDTMTDLCSKYVGVIFRRVPVQPPPGSFPDYWAAEHYAYKIWTMKQICDELAADPKAVAMYTDAGIVTVMMPKEMIAKAVTAGVCFVNDENQKNRYWFSEKFKQLLAVQESDLNQNQILAGMVVYLPSKAGPVMSAAYNMSLNRDIIAGPKWEGILPNGQPFGHRHDQAILSLLRIRMAVPTVEDKYTYTSKSLNSARLGLYPFYIHRGNFVQKDDILPNISDIIVINLKRRSDRLQRFAENHKELAGEVAVHEAIDGRALKLTPAVARLLRPNSFFWKKSVAGCCLSHLGLWYKLANSSAKSFLIFEDDAKMQPGWTDKLNAAMKAAPEGWDVLYLGGVLPPNRAGFERSKERVNGYWSKFAPNQTFGQPTPTRYFHMCAYAYVMSKQGAEKMMKLIESRDGYFAVSDHMMCDPVDVFNTYVIDPLIGGCYQDDDPSYVQSEFNNYNRVDKIDSDLWTNDERWSVEEREEALRNVGPLDIKAAINDLYGGGAPSASAPATEKPSGVNSATQNERQSGVAAAPPQKKDDFMEQLYKGIITPKATEVKNTIEAPPSPPPVIARNLLVRGMEFTPDTHDQIMEIDWLEKMLDLNIHTEAMVSSSDKFNPGEIPWIFVSRADLNKWMPIFRVFQNEGRKFYALHMSDEFGKDDISWYDLSSCQGVIRNYYRADANQSHVVTLPLGYAQGTRNELVKEQTKDLIWAFEGTGWFNRAQKLGELDELKPNHKVLHADWNAPGQKSRADYAKLIARSKFVPIVRGNHFETFRMYESLEAGSVPIYVREPGDEVYWNWLTAKIKLANIPSWSVAAKYIKHFMANPADAERYRKGISDQWTAWKVELRDTLSKII